MSANSSLFPVKSTETKSDDRRCSTGQLPFIRNPRLRRQTWPANFAQLHHERTLHHFKAQGSVKHHERMAKAREQGEDFGVSLQVRRPLKC